MQNVEWRVRSLSSTARSTSRGAWIARWSKGWTRGSSRSTTGTHGPGCTPRSIPFARVRAVEPARGSRRRRGLRISIHGPRHLFPLSFLFSPSTSSTSRFWELPPRLALQLLSKTPTVVICARAGSPTYKHTTTRRATPAALEPQNGETRNFSVKLNIEQPGHLLRHFRNSSLIGGLAQKHFALVG